MDGDEAISVFEKHVDIIDALILDVNIPPNGIYDVMVKIFSVREDIALILSSGDILDDNIRQKMEAHDGLFLRKPFVPKALLHAVTTKLEASRKLIAASKGGE